MRLNSSTVSVADLQNTSSPPEMKLNKIQSKVVKALMIAYIASMCVALPVTLFPVYILYKLKIIDRIQKEILSLKVGQFCSRWLMRLFPFARKSVIVEREALLADPQPSIWVCNHISLLDLFFMLALDKQMRGKNRRPIKILYWKGLEANPITNLLCKMCGFIPVDMSDNGNGNANEYDPRSFKQMLRATKNAINDGFDIGILPEGQPNPIPERGLQPVFSGAFTLAKMSRRPIQMMALYGLHRMWHPDENIGMVCAARDMAVRVYPGGRFYKDSEEFSSTFSAVVGHFGAHGRDLDANELKLWLDGTFWETEKSRRAATRMIVEDAENEESSSTSTEEGATTSA
jgi:1-acyl-sn-glycerol-3-phosphate acyltransferase